MPSRRTSGAASSAAADNYDDLTSDDDAQPENNDDVDPTKQPYGIVVLSHSPPKDLRFSISKKLFRLSYPSAIYNELPVRVTGCVQGWAGPCANMKLSIDWEEDKTNSLEYLATLLNPRFAFKFEQKVGGGLAKAVGTTYRCEYATATASGPYARFFQTDSSTAESIVWDIKYEEKGSGRELFSTVDAMCSAVCLNG